MFGSTGALSGVTVDVFDSNGYFEGSTITAADGSYQIIGLGTGSYAVCFESRSELGTDYSTGSVGQCTGASRGRQRQLRRGTTVAARERDRCTGDRWFHYDR